MVVAALLLAGAALSWYARSALVDGSEFSSRATAALDDSDVRTVLADHVVGGLTRSVVPDALVVRPLLVPAVAALADTTPFRRLLSRAIRDRHRALVNGETTFSFELPVGEGLLFEGLERVAPRAARAIPPDLRVPVLRLDPRDFELTAAHGSWTISPAGGGRCCSPASLLPAAPRCWQAACAARSSTSG